jgi:hypothetical protein
MPSSATPKIKELARRLVQSEASALPTGQPSAAFRVCDILRQQLSQSVGVAGFRSLLSRALVMSHGEARWLKAVHVAGNGSLEGLEAAHAHLPQDEIAEGEILLVANLMELLVTFIGEELTLRLVAEAWRVSGLENVGPLERDDHGKKKQTNGTPTSPEDR